MTREFDHLLCRAGVDRYKRGVFFGDCALVKSIILCPDADTRDALERMFGSALREVQSDVTFRVGALPAVNDSQSRQPKKWRIGDIKPWKPKPAKDQRADRGKADLLDE